MNFNIFKRNLTPQQTQTVSKQTYSPIQNSNISNNKRVNAVQTCLKILCENLSRLPLLITDSSNKETDHYLNYLLNYQPNIYQNSNQFWSMVEYHRNYYGNAFIQINRNPKGLITDFQIIHPLDYVNYTFKNNQLYLFFRLNNVTEPINYKDLLHFKCHSEHIMAESPLYSLYKSLNISKKAGDTIDNFYENNAQIPFYLSQEMPDISNKRELKEHLEKMQNENSGVENAGRALILPPYTKLTQMELKFVDAQTIDTMKFTRDEICSAFGIPNFMLNDSDGALNIEQQSLLFRSFTIEPNLSIYNKELTVKLLTQTEIKNKISIKFDSNVLIDSDLKTKAESYYKIFLSGAITPNKLAEKFNLPMFDSDEANQPYLQAQQLGLKNNFEKNGQ